MMDYQFDLVGKIGSMALIRKEDKDIDYNIFSRLGAENGNIQAVMDGDIENFIHAYLVQS